MDCSPLIAPFKPFLTLLNPSQHNVGPLTKDDPGEGKLVFSPPLPFIQSVHLESFPNPGVFLREGWVEIAIAATTTCPLSAILLPDCTDWNEINPSSPRPLGCWNRITIFFFFFSKRIFHLKNKGRANKYQSTEAHNLCFGLWHFRISVSYWTSHRGLFLQITRKDDCHT